MKSTTMRHIFTIILLTVLIALGTPNPSRSQGNLNLWVGTDNQLWVENDAYRLNLPEGTSLVLKTGSGEVEWHPTALFSRYWLTGDAQTWCQGACGTLGNWGNNVIESLEILSLTDSRAIVRIINRTDHPLGIVRIAMTLTFLADSPAIRVDTELLESTFPSPIVTLGAFIFALPGGDFEDDFYTWSGGSEMAFPYAGWSPIWADDFIPVGGDFIHLSFFDTDVNQGLALVTELSDTHERCSDCPCYGIAVVEGFIYATESDILINLDASQVSTYYILPFTVDPSDHVQEVEDFINSLLNPTITVEAGGPYSVGEGGSVLVSASSDAQSDSLTYAWDLDGDDIFETPGQSATISAAGMDGPSQLTVRVQASDSGGNSGMDSAIVDIINTNPTVMKPSVLPEPSIEGGEIFVSAAFSDPAPDDAPFTCTIDYGDGSGSYPGTVEGSTCFGPSHVYADYGLYKVSMSVMDKDGALGAVSVDHLVIFDFAGFFPPVDNLPVFNQVKAGQAIPVKFSLGGYRSLEIFRAGFPISRRVSCSEGLPIDEIEQTMTAGNSSLSYDHTSQRYQYVWKTEKAWAGTCRQLVVLFLDGTQYSANFKFK